MRQVKTWTEMRPTNCDVIQRVVRFETKDIRDQGTFTAKREKSPFWFLSYISVCFLVSFPNPFIIPVISKVPGRNKNASLADRWWRRSGICSKMRGISRKSLRFCVFKNGDIGYLVNLHSLWRVGSAQ